MRDGFRHQAGCQRAVVGAGLEILHDLILGPPWPNILSRRLASLAGGLPAPLPLPRLTVASGFPPEAAVATLIADL
jgi:hypothetical protein